MRFVRRLSALLALLAALAAVAPAAAGAFTNAPVGSSVHHTLTSPVITFGSFAQCTGSSWDGVVTVDNGPGNGGSGNFTSVTFSGCTVFGSPATVTANNLPWTWSENGSGVGTISGVDLTFRWGSLSCSFRGSLSWSYDWSTGILTISGSLVRYAGTSLCPSPSAVQGTFKVVNAANVPVQP